MRIRSIKPEFWRDETIVSLPISARLTFIGLWSYVDDNGVGDARLSSIVADLYAHDLSCNLQETLRSVSGDLQQLQNAGLIVMYTDPNQARRELVFIRNWDKHQVVNRPSKGHSYPLPPAEMLDQADTHANCMSVSRDTPETLSAGAGEQGSRGTGEQTTTARERARAPRESSSTFADGTPIPPEPPHDSDEHVVVAEIVPTEIGTASTPRTPKPSPAHKTTVRTILGGAGYPDTTITQLATQVGKLAGKHDAELIAEALREWDRRPDVKPAFLGSVLGDVVKARRARPDQPKSKLRALAELANEERSRENDHQPNRKELA